MKLGQVTQREAPASSQDEPNVAPLIDIVFILLIFFVVTTTFAKDLGIDIDRPRASTGAQQPTELVRVAVGRRGELTVDGRATSAWRLEAEVQERLSHYLSKSVLVVADGSVDTKTLVRVIDQCRSAGATQVAIAAEAGR